MTFPVGHTNGSDTGDDHTTDYGAGTAMVIVILGFVLIGLTVATPWFMGDSYYTPLYGAPRQVLVVQGKPVTPTQPQKTGAVVSPGNTLVAAEEAPTPDLSCLKTV